MIHIIMSLLLLFVEHFHSLSMSRLSPSEITDYTFTWETGKEGIMGRHIYMFWVHAQKLAV